MKNITPEYYKDFKCIAGDCTDTCCAGWDVDVDEKAYTYYKNVKGEFGKKLEAVMVPDEEGGCTFTLNEGRCPFLNNKNLCDLYIALGENQLCETCDEFPRFINEYGNTREMGIAPSCKTAGELIFNYKERLTFHEEDKDEQITHYNDIDPQLYYQLLQARKTAYKIAQNRNWTISERCHILLVYAQKIQKKIDAERDDLIANVVKSFSEETYCEKLIANRPGENSRNAELAYEAVFHFYDKFKEMEVINPDWLKYCDRIQDFKKMCDSMDGYRTYIQLYDEFDQYYQDRQFEYEQMLMYYLFRYFLDAVNDYNLLLKIKVMEIGYLALKHLDIAAWYDNHKQLNKTEQIDIAHLYSRQLEHSYINFEKYMEFYESKNIYSCASIFRLLR